MGDLAAMPFGERHSNTIRAQNLPSVFRLECWETFELFQDELDRVLDLRCRFLAKLVDQCDRKLKRGACPIIESLGAASI
jgi:hypothetical protein